MSLHQADCSDRHFEVIGDCGEVTGFDLTLLRCAGCGAYAMDFYWAGSNTANALPPSVLEPYETVRDELAACLARLQA